MAFLNLSLISVETRKAYPLSTQQIVRDKKEGCIKDKSVKKSKKKKHGKVGRPKGSGNQDKKILNFLPILNLSKESVNKALKRIDKHIDIVYFCL
ncbi:MAG: hypothetical protein Q9M36_08020 [Sulfurovum sp.]|nr:hypothetical protein [Sulfurovum sp.]